MYCVKCGVRLQEGVKECPLCQTPVWNPEGPAAEKSYPDRLPGQYRQSDLPGAIALTVLCLVASLVTLIVCMKLYGELRWGGYVILGIALFYVVAALPRWFRHPLGRRRKTAEKRPRRPPAAWWGRIGRPGWSRRRS